MPSVYPPTSAIFKYNCDSRSALQAIGHINPTDNYLLIGEIHASTSQLEHRGINITFNWVPSHIGINGNELADSIALEARQLDSYTYDPPPSIASCFEEMLFKFKQNWKHSVYNSDKSSVQRRYLQINPLLKPFKST